jgi:hypothetical protein
MRKDTTPEQATFQDTGCALYHQCTECPLPCCVYDMNVSGPKMHGYAARARYFALVQQSRDAHHLSELSGLAVKTAFGVIRRYHHAGGDFSTFLGVTPLAKPEPRSPKPRAKAHLMFINKVPGPGEFRLEKSGDVVDATNARRILLNRLLELGYSKALRDQAIQQALAAPEAANGASLSGVYQVARAICEETAPPLPRKSKKGKHKA